jgi:hypothetical protein
VNNNNENNDKYMANIHSNVLTWHSVNLKKVASHHAKVSSLGQYGWVDIGEGDGSRLMRGVQIVAPLMHPRVDTQAVGFATSARRRGKKIMKMIEKTCLP